MNPAINTFLSLIFASCRGLYRTRVMNSGRQLGRGAVCPWHRAGGCLRPLMKSGRPADPGDLHGVTRGHSLPTRLLPDTSLGDPQGRFPSPSSSPQPPSPGAFWPRNYRQVALCRTVPRIKRCCSGSAPLDGRLLFSFANPTTLCLPDESSSQVLHSSQVCTAPRHCTFGWTWE